MVLTLNTFGNEVFEGARVFSSVMTLVGSCKKWLVSYYGLEKMGFVMDSVCHQLEVCLGALDY